MDEASILDLKGDSPIVQVNVSHLGSGSPDRQELSFKHKRVKHFKDNPQTTELQASLKQDIIDLLKNDKVSRPYAMIYRDVERLCISSHSEQSNLAKELYHEMDTWLNEEVSPKIRQLLQSIPNGSIEELSQTLLSYLRAWKRKLDLLSQLFLYLDQAYLKGHPKKSRIAEYGLQGIMNHLTHEPPHNSDQHKSTVYDLVIDLLKKVRSRGVSEAGEAVAQELVSSLYLIDKDKRPDLKKSIESGFMDDYKVFHKEWLRDDKNYVILFLGQVAADAAFFSSSGFDSPFIQRLISLVKWKFLLSDMELYVKPSFSMLLETDKKQYLDTLFQFCEDSADDYGVNFSASLINYWRDYIQMRLSVLTSSEDIITDLVCLWGELNGICKTIFKDENYGFELRNTVLKFLALKGVSSQTVLSLSKFCDNFMKQASNSDEDYNKFESDVLVVFKLLANKADFTTVYERALSKRMLLSRHFDLFTEKKLVESFIMVIGESDENSNLRAMFRDYETSKNAPQNLTVSNSPDAVFNALILERKFWPDFPAFGSELKLPPTFQSTLESFETQYKLCHVKNKYHNLDWKNFALHQIVLEANFDSGSKQLFVNLLQAAVLVLFEETCQLTFDHILEASNLDAKLLRRVLASLATKRFPILIIENDVIYFNTAFDDKLSKIRLPLGKEKDVLKIDDPTRLTIRSRSSEIRSAIVRVMKDQRTLPHPALLGKVIEILSPRGSPHVLDIKVELENLISNEFLRRDDDGTTLHYVP